MKLENCIALVTGAGSGIGRAIALLYAEQGAVVIVNDINLDAANNTSEEIGRANGKAYVARADVSDSVQVKSMFSEIALKFHRLDVLVNNAGIAEASVNKRKEINRRGEARLSEMRTGPIQTHWDVTEDMSDEEWSRVLSVHLNGTFFCTREALKLMGREHRGVIINMSSVAALEGIPFAPHYSAAKGGILAFTRSLAQEVASRNIRVNAICPGLITTPMTEGFSPLLKAAFAMRIPMGREGTPREVAATALFLASDDSSYFTGQWLSPNGGFFIG
jgi:3-oxoacyl-[acyl-carrier protein] reductase